MERGAQFLFQARRCRVPAARQRADDHTVLNIQIVENPARGMTEPSGHTMAYHGIADGFGDDQSDSGSGLTGLVGTKRVQHEVGLGRPRPSTDCGTELGRPGHPVLRRKHRVRPDRVTQSVNDGPLRGEP